MVVDVRTIDTDLLIASRRLSQAEGQDDLAAVAVLEKYIDELLDARTEAVAEQDQCLR